MHKAFDTKMIFYSHPNITHFYGKVFAIVVSAMSSHLIGMGLSPFVDILFGPSPNSALLLVFRSSWDDCIFQRAFSNLSKILGQTACIIVD